MTDFNSWLVASVKTIDNSMQQQAEQRQQQLTKPAGSLGQLEQIAVQLAALQAKEQPQVDKVQITIFAGDHGIVEQGVSAFPQSVTAEMIRNFSRGGAAISVLAKQNDCGLSVFNMGTVSELEPLEQVIDARIAAGTHNFVQQAAMSEQQCQQAMLQGRDHISQLVEQGVELFIGGEMGIGNTSAATAIACVLLNKKPDQLVGPGTGLDSLAVSNKSHIIEQALNLHKTQMDTPLAVLRHVGGFEIAALTGAYLQCAKLGLVVLIDGFISSVAALLADKICPGSRQWFLFSHCSAEPGHQYVLAELKASYLLNIGMRLGEASGAAVALPLIRLSCALHNEMATFAQAAVSKQ